MNRLIRFLPLLLLPLFVMSCKKNDNNGGIGGKDQISISETEVICEEIGRKVGITVSSNGYWSATSDSPWVVLSTASGTGNGTTTVTVNINDSGANRTGKVTFTCAESSIVLTITQAGTAGASLINLDQDEIILPANITSSSVGCLINTDYEVLGEGWAKVDPANSTRTSVKLILEKNTSNLPRTATLILKQIGGTLQKSLTVFQYGQPDMRIGDDLSVGALAFPGADGAGRMTTGGRGGKVLYVNSLGDTNTGSGNSGTLRWCLEQTGSRTILFNVSGRIKLTGDLKISKGDVTIAGQSAPGDGICISDYTTSVGSNNVIVRFMRFRMGDEAKTENDAFKGENLDKIMVDHCSMSWSTDECSSWYKNTNYTMQWCTMSESLRNSVHDKGTHGYGAIWGGRGVSFHHNLFACHDSRNPRFCGTRYFYDGANNGGITYSQELEVVDFRNNVIFNWGINSGYAGEGGRYNMINNYYRPGPATKTSSGVQYRIFSANNQSPTGDGSTTQEATVWGKFFFSGNYMTNVDGSTNLNVINDNMVGFQLAPSSSEFSVIKESLLLPSAVSVAKVATHSAVGAFEMVKSYGGASLRRDAVDTRIMGYVGQTGTISFPYVGAKGSANGFIDTQSDVGGWPTYKQLPVLKDTDGDGIPDIWEDSYGLNKNIAADGNTKTLDPSGRYTNLEVYLNNLVQHIVYQQIQGATYQN